MVGEGGGTLGSAHDPFRLRYEPGAGVRLPDAQLPESVSAARLEARWDLRHQLDGGITPAASPAARLDRHYELAHALIASSQSLSALDVEREPARRAPIAYGPHRFGQCCLIARRLVEAGSPFVQVNWSTHVEAIEDSGDGGWDMHDRYFAIMQDQHGWMFDRALSALIEDLDDADCSTRRWSSRWASSAARRRSTTAPAASITGTVLHGAAGRRRSPGRPGDRHLRQARRASGRPSFQPGRPGRHDPRPPGHRRRRPDRDQPRTRGPGHRGAVLNAIPVSQDSRGTMRALGSAALLLGLGLALSISVAASPDRARSPATPETVSTSVVPPGRLTASGWHSRGRKPDSTHMWQYVLRTRQGRILRAGWLPDYEEPHFDATFAPTGPGCCPVHDPVHRHPGEPRHLRDQRRRLRPEADHRRGPGQARRTRSGPPGRRTASRFAFSSTHDGNQEIYTAAARRLRRRPADPASRPRRPPLLVARREVDRLRHRSLGNGPGDRRASGPTAPA